ncbi:hypothetical protein CYMTET_17280 [Cymbomonas tetramitiformis]|uniref:GST C-terminal domain-containing protein n=1 Tax=Cymbomonas tetramitiformis TaxID=36881 RepID=A0AAE0GAR0_9CHLO|nr:hypothetical protein CYMTET_17280 [Cymbomonas tetramitiformis]|eukprot:gene8586-10194_t
MVQAHSALDEVNSSGEFKRNDSIFRDFISKDSTQFRPAATRYHLYISYACPWATRCLAVLHMKGLQEVISVSVVHPTWQRTKPDDPEDEHCGWVFADSAKVSAVTSSTGMGSFNIADSTVDHVNSCTTIRELYTIAGDSLGKYTVPILWDKESSTIVNNESAEILRMLNSEFNEWAAHPNLDLYPESMKSAIDAVNEWVYPAINNGVYRCGFALTQPAYDSALEELYSSLDRVEKILSTQRYIAGNVVTEADIRLFMTLIRFDEVYVVYFKTNRKCIREYPNMFNYIKEIFQLPGVSQSINMAHIKTHYFTSHPKLNVYAIIPGGPCIDYSSAHDRGLVVPV